MKKLLVLLSTLFVCSFAHAQLGIKAGINKSNLSTTNDDIIDLESNKGFQAGFVYKLNISDVFAIQPELLYVRKGADYSILSKRVDLTMDYVEVPLSIVVKPFKCGLNFHAGLQASKLVHTKVTYENEPEATIKEFESGKDNFEDFDYGWVAGLGYQVDHFLIGLRYARSMKKFERSVTIDDIAVEPTSTYYSLQASVSVFF